MEEVKRHMVLRRTDGFFIINGVPIELGKGQEVSYREDAEVVEFPTKEDLDKTHRKMYPKWYLDNE